MSTMEIQSLNPNITNDRISMPYPHLKLLDPSDAIALILPSLKDGELPVICEYNGTVRQLAKVKKSALVLNTLLKVSGLVYAKDVNTNLKITSTSEIMEVL